MRLRLGSRPYDLATRALVLGIAGAPAALVEQGADLVEWDGQGPAAPSPVPVLATACDRAGVDRALAAGADLVRLPGPAPTSLLRDCAQAGVAVVIPAGAAPRAAAAGLTPERILPDDLLLDVDGAPCPLAAMVAGVVGGARIVRTADVRAARRVVDVLAAIDGAGR